ncbi:MAG TPA: hypothetical protein ENN20_08150 [Candidatus Marinimicrobia bacterium]|nr:hypothetical protein [Candidatus Neomarinimicrobiota bacterium]
MNQKLLHLSLLIIMALLLGVMTSLESQTLSDPVIILGKVQAPMEAIADYSVTVTVSVAVPNLRMPDKELRLFYQQPDKIHVETDGFAMLPKVGLVPSQINQLLENVKMTLKSTPEQNESGAYIINLQHLEAPSKMTTTIWINPKRWTLDKVLMNVPDIAETVITIQYQKFEGFWLPEAIKVYLNMQQSIPAMQRPSIEYPVGYFGGSSGKEPVSGIITLDFGDYRVNQGIDSKIFE